MELDRVPILASIVFMSISIVVAASSFSVITAITSRLVAHVFANEVQRDV